MKSFNWKASLLAVLMVLPTAGYSSSDNRPDFSQKPLSVGSSAPPNLMFILDDSGSMGLEYMPDFLGDGGRSPLDPLGWFGENIADIGISCQRGVLGLCIPFTFYRDGSKAKARMYYSSKVNAVWYNPEITYRPPYKPEGTGRYDSSIYGGAPRNGFKGQGNKDDLRDAFFTQNYDGSFLTSSIRNGGFYYDFDDVNCNEKSEADLGENDCYTYVSLNNESSEQKRNFANWFTFYNTRIKAARAGIAEAFYGLPKSFRLGWGAINNTGSNVDGVKNLNAVTYGVREYDEDRREEFLTWLYNVSANGSITPLKTALDGAGKYYEGSKQAWADDPSEDVNESNPARECRQSYTILMSDGYYTDTVGGFGNADGSNGLSIDKPSGGSYTYESSGPFKDGRSDTLADVAMHYWKKDLHADKDLHAGIDNYVPTSTKNPAFWQHMSTYTVGFGLGADADIQPDEAFNAINEPKSIEWWKSGGGDRQRKKNKVNDLLHAAVNGRGGYFSANDPETFTTELTRMVREILAEAGSSTSIAFNVSSFQEGALMFGAEYDPNSWSGDIKAAKLGGKDSPIVPDLHNAVASDDGWSAQKILDERDLSSNDRTIITRKPAGNAGAFRWSFMLGAMKSDLKYGSASDATAEQRLDFIRGNRSLEDTLDFRKRGSRLGSIVNSTPEFVGGPRANWPDLEPFGTSGDRFSAFAKDKEGRDPVVYAGSNDGMLHGFKATENGGQEVLAYIPSFVYSNEDKAGLHFLTSPDYSHRYYVDLELRQQDIYTKGVRSNGSLTGEAWRSIVVGGGRSGAKGIFALDVTDPSSFSEANAKAISLWEFTEDDDARLGHVTQAPIISMANWGSDNPRWTAFVANGYNSTTKTTGFFMLDIEGGMDGWDIGDIGDIKYIEFESGGAGLSPLAVLDTTGDFVANRVYAGDLDGNLWVAEESGGNWGAVYSDGKPLFKTASDQPITAAPVVAENKLKSNAGNEPNLVVYFGTGQYLEQEDVATTAGQSVYGVWDHGNSDLKRANLQKRTLTEKGLSGAASTKVRYSTGDKLNLDSKHGWYADLPTGGERVVVSPQLRGDFVYLNTMIPDPNPCLGGGRGWLMAFGLDGLTPNSQAFLKFKTPVAGYKSKGIPGQSSILGNFRFTPASSAGNSVDVTELPPLTGSAAGTGRRGWKELTQD